jgi:predicted ATPase
VFVEDLQWCDASTLELLGHVIGLSPDARMLLLATARPEFTSPWPAHANLTRMRLARLTAPESGQGSWASAVIPALRLPAWVSSQTL